MDKKYIEENEIEIKYLRNQLTDDELEEFEVYLMEHPEMVDKLEMDMMLIDFENDQMKQKTPMGINVRKPKTGYSLNRLLGWLAVPVPAYAAVAAVALITPTIAIQFSSQRSDQLELVAFSSSITRGESQNISHEFDIITNLSLSEGRSAMMIKVTPDIKQFYLLEVYDYSVPENDPVWTSPPFAVKSGTRDQIISLPSSALVPNARIRVLGKEREGNYTAVRFCHYSEACL